MQITFLGQAGLLFRSAGLTVMVDPYFSDNVAALDATKHRRVPLDPSLWNIRPDVLVLTHDHADHYDPFTADRILNAHTGITVLSPRSVWSKIRAIGQEHRYVLFSPRTSWTQAGITFTAAKAEHSDPDAIGVLIREGNKTYYVTGDTLYNEDVFADLPEEIDTVFLPVNGEGNNMNATDAARFATRIGAKHAIPLHTGLLDDFTADSFHYAGKVVPVIYQPIPLE